MMQKETQNILNLFQKILDEPFYSKNAIINYIANEE